MIPKAIHRFNTILIKIPTQFKEIEPTIFNSIWKYTRTPKKQNKTKQQQQQKKKQDGKKKKIPIMKELLEESPSHISSCIAELQ